MIKILKKKFKLYDKQLKNIKVKTPMIVKEAFLKFRVYSKFQVLLYQILKFRVYLKFQVLLYQIFEVKGIFKILGFIIYQIFCECIIRHLIIFHFIFCLQTLSKHPQIYRKWFFLSDPFISDCFHGFIIKRANY